MTNSTRTAWDELPLPFLRIVGRHLTANQQMRQAWQEHRFDIAPVNMNMADLSMIDPTLPMQPPAGSYAAPAPGYRPTFAQLSPEQRWTFWQWLRTHEGNLPAGYAVIYLQHLAAALFDASALAALQEMRWLLEHERALSVREFASYDLAIGAWLHRQADLFAWVVNHGSLGSWQMGMLLFFQNQLGVHLGADQALGLGRLFRYSWGAWARQHPQEVEGAVTAELAATGNTWLSRQISSLPGELHTMQIQLINPGLRFVVQAMDLCSAPGFERATNDLLQAAERGAQLGGHFTERPRPVIASGPAWVDRGWYVVLEFGESASEKLKSTVVLARRHPGFIKLLDENREIVYRNVYQRRDLPRFWALFERVRGWKGTRVFVNGDPVKIEGLWPGAPEME